MTIFLKALVFFPPIWIVVLFFGGFSKVGNSSLDQYPILSDVIDLSKKGEVSWQPDTTCWKSFLGLIPYKGEAFLSLNFGYPSFANAGESDLDVKMSAFGINSRGERQNRWIINSYITTDKPFSKPRNIWEVGNEWGLGLVEIQGKERITINMSVLEPNIHPKLQCPRLKLIVKHDHAWRSYGRQIYCNVIDFLFSALAVGISVFAPFYSSKLSSK